MSGVDASDGDVDGAFADDAAFEDSVCEDSALGDTVPWYALVPPTALAGELPREGVWQALDEAVAAGPVTVVSAPSGFGKTVSVAAWCRGRDDVGWVTASAVTDPRLTLDAGLRAAIRAADPGVRLQVRAGFRTALADAVGRLSRPAILVVDDAHLATGERLCELLMDDVLDTGMLRLVLVGQPALRGAVTCCPSGVGSVVIGGGTLAYAREELRRGYGEQGDALYDATSGWPAAVRFGAASSGARNVLRAAGAPARRAADRLSARVLEDPLLTDYIGEVVLPSLPSASADVFLDTVVLGAFSAELAERVLGFDATAILDRCVEDGMLARLSAGGRSGYRWHDTVVVHGMRLAQRRDPARVRRVEMAAARALWESDPVEAGRFAVRAGEPETAVEILRAGWIRTLLSSNTGALDAFCVSLPAPYDSDPDVLRIRACGRRLIGDVEMCVQLARRALAVDAERAASPTLLTRVADAFLAEPVGGDVDRALTAAEAGLARVPAGESMYERFLVGWVRMRRPGDPAVYVSGMTEIADVAESRGLTELVRNARLEVALLQMLTGRLSAVDAVFAGDRRGGAEAAARFQAGRAGFMRGFAAYWRGDFDEAVDHLAAVVRDPETVEQPRCHAAIYLVAAVVDGGRTDRWDDARAALDALPETATHWPPWDLFRRCGQAQLQSAMGQPERAASLAASLIGEEVGQYTFAWLAAVLRDAGSPAAAMAAVRRARIGGTSTLTRVAVTTTEALLALDAGRHAEAVRLAENALDLASPERLWQPFLRQTPGMRQLLSLLRARRSRHAEIVAELSARRADLATVDTLTDRQEEVLAALRDGSSAGEIAERLGLSVTTVKTHIRTIYRKLGVSSRRDALRATEHTVATVRRIG